MQKRENFSQTICNRHFEYEMILYCQGLFLFITYIMWLDHLSNELFSFLKKYCGLKYINHTYKSQLKKINYFKSG